MQVGRANTEPQSPQDGSQYPMERRLHMPASPCTHHCGLLHTRGTVPLQQVMERGMGTHTHVERGGGGPRVHVGEAAGAGPPAMDPGGPPETLRGMPAAIQPATVPPLH